MVQNILIYLKEHPEITIIISSISLLVSIFTVLVVYLQLRTMNVSMNRDHTRRERQATLEYLEKNFPRIDELYWSLKEKYGTEGAWSIETIQDIESDRESKKAVNDMLNRVEVLSIGVHNGIFSFDVICDYAELQLTKMHEQCWPIVLYWGDKYRRDSICEHFDSLVRQIVEKRKPIKAIKRI